MNTEELQKLIDAAEPEDRLSIVQSYMLENKLVFKQRIVGNQGNEPTPRHIVGLGTSSATIQSSADRVQRDQKIRLAYSPLPGGPYSLSGYEVRGNGSLAQPIVAQISGLAPDNTYYFVIQVVNKDGSIDHQSDESTFTTLSHSPFTNPASDIRMTTAVISGGTKHIGQLERVQLWYALGEEEFKPLLNNPHTLTGLQPNTSYGFFLQITDENRNVLDESPVRTFKTLDYVAEIKTEEVRASSAVLVAKADFVPSNQSIKTVYRKSGDKDWIPASVTVGDNSRGQESSFRVFGLEHSSKYEAKSQVIVGDKVAYESKVSKFTTDNYSLDILVENLLAATVDINGVHTWVETSESVVLYLDGIKLVAAVGKGLEYQLLSASPEDISPSTDHEARIDVLNRDGVVVDSFTKPFTTKAHNPDAIDVVNIRDRSAALVGSADHVQRNGFTRFAWKKSADRNYLTYSPLMFGDISESQRFVYLAFGLEPDTDYEFVLQMIATDGATVTDQSPALAFKTPPVKRRKA